MNATLPAITGLGALVVVLAACTANSPENRDAEIGIGTPAKWSATARTRPTVDDAWIERFKDRRLNELVEEAINNNRDLQSVAGRIGIAQANAELAGVEMQPLINAALTGSRNKQNFIGFPSAFGDPTTTTGGAAPDSVVSTTSNRFGTSLDLTWELDVWGRVRAGQSAAIGRLEASEADYSSAKISLAAQVAKSWFALTEALQQQELARETLANFQNTEEVIRDRFESGQTDSSGTGAQLRLAMSDVSSAEAFLEQRSGEVQVAVRQLELLLGRYPAGAVERSSTLPSLPPPPPSGLPSELVQRRPDIIAAERRFAAAGEQYQQAVLDYFPRFAITSGVGTSSEQFSDIFDSDFGVWNIAGNIVQPILDGGRLDATKRLREAEERVILADLQQTVLQAFSEVEIALVSEGYLTRRVNALEEAVDLAADANQQSRDDYRDGVGDILTVLAAQNQLVTTRSQLLTVRRLRLDNRINLHLALGGDFRPRSMKEKDSLPQS